MSDLTNLSPDDQRTLMILLMEDIRGAFYPVNPRTDAVIELANHLGYSKVAERAEEYLEDPDDGRHFRTLFTHGGYEDPPFPVTRYRADATPELIDALESLCEFPESRLRDDDE